jgi:hypothetical protein
METGWPVKSVTQRVYDALEPVAGSDVRSGWPLLAYIDALGLMFQKASDLVEDGDNGEPGWSIILDIDRVPDEGLDWLAQFLGITFYVGMDDATKRQQIRGHASWQRGTPAQIALSIGLFMTGTKTVQLTERNPTPYSFQVIIWATEAPADVSQTSPLVRYVNAYAKPAGLKWTLTVNPGPPPATTYAAIYTRGDTYGYLYNSFQTYGDIR